MTSQSNSDTETLKFIHGFLVWVIGWWSFVLSLPGETFERNPKLYHLFTVIMTEDQWSVFLGIVAVIGFIGIKWKPARLASIHFLCLIHALIAALLFIPNPIGTGSGLYGGLSVAGYYLLWRQRHPKVQANV